MDPTTLVSGVAEMLGAVMANEDRFQIWNSVAQVGRELKEAFIAAGFSEEEAFQLTLAGVKNIQKGQS